MLSFWVFLIIAFVVWVGFAAWLGLDGLDIWLGGIFLIVILFMIIGGMYLHDDLNVKEENIRIEYRNKTEIFSIINNSGVEGSFFLGSGHIESNLYYFLRIGNEKDGYIIKKYNANETYIIPEDTKNPYVIEKTKIYDKKYNSGIIIGGLLKKIEDKKDVKIVEKIELHLPKKYILQNYTIQ